MAMRLRAVTNETSEFEAAKARWEKVSAARRALRDRLDGAKAALVLADYRPGPGEYLSPVLEDKARRYLDGRRPDRDRLAREIAELDAELADAATTYTVESAAWRSALEAEARRRAEAVQPKLKALVRALARSVERLNDDVEALRGLQAQLAEVGGGRSAGPRAGAVRHPGRVQQPGDSVEQARAEVGAARSMRLYDDEPVKIQGFASVFGVVYQIGDNLERGAHPA
jgi:hypothetical protein